MRWLALLGAVMSVTLPTCEPSPPPSSDGPPPATLRAGARAITLAIGSYCWSSGNSAICVDKVAPDPDDLPVLEVPRGGTVELALGFDPEEVELSVGGQALPSSGDATIRWRADRGGVVSVFALTEGGDVSYDGRIRLAGG